MAVIQNQGSLSQEGQVAPLKIVIVGAGIGGLSAAIALRSAGHIVEVVNSPEVAICFTRLMTVGLRVESLRTRGRSGHSPTTKYHWRPATVWT